MNRHTSSHRQSVILAVCSMTVALSAVVMLTSSLLTIMTYAAPLMAGILLIPVMLEFGQQYAWLTWFAAALLTLILGFDKELALFYLCFGFYPVLKPRLDRIPTKPMRLTVKLLLFTVLLSALYAFLILVLHLDSVVQDFAEMGQVFSILFLIALDCCLLLYDHLLGSMMFIYIRRFREKFRHTLRI